MEAALASVQGQPQSSRTGACKSPFSCFPVFLFPNSLTTIPSCLDTDLSLLADTLKQASSSPSLVSDLDAFVQNVLQSSTGLVVSRQVIAEYAKAVQEANIEDADVRKQVLQNALVALSPHVVTFEEQVRSLVDCSVFLSLVERTAKKASVGRLGHRAASPACRSL